MPASSTFGAIALVGSGEYLSVMNETDRFLLNSIKARNAEPRVVIIPTASALEANGPKYWTDLGLGHFQGLGVNVQPAMILKPEDASKPEILTLLEQADFYYFSGGNPSYLIDTLAGSPALQIIEHSLATGAVIAGCSAGAMAMGAYTTGIRAAMGGQLQWVKGWNISTNLITMPHFDRMANFAGPDFMLKITQNVPAGCRLLGVDEDTALVRTNGAEDYQWQVMGRQTVSVFGNDGQRKIYQSGETVPL